MPIISQFINKVFDLFLSSALNFANAGGLLLRSRDLSILAVLAGLFVVYGIFFGEIHLVMIILSTYISYTVLAFLPLNNSVFNFYGLDFYFRLLVFICLIAVVYILLVSFYRFFRKKNLKFSLIRMILLGISEVLLFVVLMSGFFTDNFEFLLSDMIKKYLLDDNWKFFFVILPLIVVGLRTMKKNRNI